MSDIEIGRAKRARRAYAFDDIAVVPSRRTRDPQDVSISWTIDAFTFEIPVLAAPMDSVVSPAVAIAIGLALPTAAGFALGSFLLGLPFTALTYFALQEVRRLRPNQVAATTGLVTAIWSLGQTAGPPMVAVLLGRTSAVGAAFTLSLAIAAGALVVGAVVFLVSSRLWPRTVAG